MQYPLSLQEWPELLRLCQANWAAHFVSIRIDQGKALIRQDLQSIWIYECKYDKSKARSDIEGSSFFLKLESRRRRTKGSVVGEEWCQNAAPLRWYTKNVFAQSKMILSRAWLHDTVSCAAWNDARKGVYLKPLFKTPCSNCYWGWSIPIMLDYRDISLMESVPLMWGPVTASPVGIEPMTIFGGEGAPPPYNWYPIHNGENSMNSVVWPPNTP